MSAALAKAPARDLVCVDLDRPVAQALDALNARLIEHRACAVAYLAQRTMGDGVGDIMKRARLKRAVEDAEHALSHARRDLDAALLNDE